MINTLYKICLIILVAFGGILAFRFVQQLPFQENLLLLETIQKGEVKDVAALLDKGADPDGKPLSLQVSGGGEGESPLVVAVCERNTKMVRLLLSRHADPNYSVYIGTPLTAAVENDDAALIDLLVQNGAKVYQDPGYSYPFQRAVIDGKPNAVKALLRHGADSNMSWDGETALNASIHFNHNDVAEILRKAGAK